jgi:hypothetical protein
MEITRGIFDWGVACFFLRQIWDPCQPVLWNILLWERTLGCLNEELSERTKRNCLGKWQPSSLFCMYGDQNLGYQHYELTPMFMHGKNWFQAESPENVFRWSFRWSFRKTVVSWNCLSILFAHLIAFHSQSSFEVSNIQTRFPSDIFGRNGIPVKSSWVSITTRSSTRVWSLAGRNLDSERPLSYGTITYDTPEKRLSDVNIDWSIIRSLRNWIYILLQSTARAVYLSLNESWANIF